MADESRELIIREGKPKSIFRENLEMLSQPDNFQKYILGTKKNGSPRAVYDVVKDYTKPKKDKKKKHKKNKKHNDSTYSFYLNTKSKKHKKKKNKKHWSLD